MSVLWFDETTPNGNLTLGVDFTNLLPSAVTLSGCTVTCSVIDTSPDSDSSASTRVANSGTATIAGTVASIRFSGGVDAVDYLLEFAGTFSNADVEPVKTGIRVRAD